MEYVAFERFPVEKGDIEGLLREKGICINEYARAYMTHPGFVTPGELGRGEAAICSLGEMGFEDGAVFEDIFKRAERLGLRPCKPDTGLFLRLSYSGQAMSVNDVLSGTYRAPDGAVTVLSEFLSEDEGFPKGLYLRNVGGRLWLRGYVCPREYAWQARDVFAFERIEG